MCIPRQSVRTPLDYDQQFEGQLPPEVRAELETSPSPVNRQPVRIPESEQEIKEVIAWLKSQGYLPPTGPAPSSVRRPPAPPPVVQAPKPAPPERTSRGGGWGLIWMVIGGFFLWALLHNHGSQPSASRALSEQPSRAASLPQPQTQPEVRRALPVDVRRAMAVVPRAQLASPSEAQAGEWHAVTLLNGSVVGACYEGNLGSPADLPPQGRFLGEEWSTGAGQSASDWIWLKPVGSSFASWVDP